MKIKNSILILILILFCNNSFATFKYKEGDYISGGINITSKPSIPLTEGNWQVIYRNGIHIFRGIHA